MIICLVYKWLKQLCSSDKWEGSVIDQVKKNKRMPDINCEKMELRNFKSFYKLITLVPSLRKTVKKRQCPSSLERTIREGNSQGGDGQNWGLRLLNLKSSYMLRCHFMICFECGQHHFHQLGSGLVWWRMNWARAYMHSVCRVDVTSCCFKLPPSWFHSGGLYPGTVS